MKQVIMYTDGACRRNPGPGGWGVLIKYEGIDKEIFGAPTFTVNKKLFWGQDRLDYALDEYKKSI